MDERSFRYVECSIPSGMTAQEYLRHVALTREDRSPWSGLASRLTLASLRLVRRPGGDAPGRREPATEPLLASESS
jgi:hypothetical protein